MIVLLINHQEVELPSDFTFTMEYENEFFTKSSEYSLDIELPLKDSPTNQRVFGHINRLVAKKEKLNLPAEAYVNGHCVANGYAELVKMTAESITVQLLGGTSYFNYSSNDQFIDEMDLGYCYGGAILKEKDTTWFHYYGLVKEEVWDKFYGSVDDTDMVFFWSLYKDPEKVNTSELRPYQPFMPCYPLPSFASTGGAAFYHYALFKTMCQPYLVRVIEKIMAAIGYKIRRNDIAHCWLRNLYIVNYNTGSIVKQETAIDYDKKCLRSLTAKALPHWKLSTFISEVEKFCACIFVFNDHNKTVDIKMLSQFYDEQANIVTIDSQDVLDQYEFEFSDSSTEQNVTEGNVMFDQSYSDKYLQVSKEIMNSIQRTVIESYYPALLDAYNKDTEGNKEITLYVDRSTGREYIHYKAEDGSTSFKEINVFGMLDRGADNNVELKIVPANTKFFNVGWWFDETAGSPKATYRVNVPFSSNEMKEAQTYSKTQEIIENDYSTEEQGESSDCIQVMINTGQRFWQTTYEGTQYKYPVPFTDTNMPTNADALLPPLSLSLKPVCTDSLGFMYRNIPSYDSGKKFVIKFISSTIPDSRSVFLVNNQRYVCYKLTAEFGKQTQQFIVEGEFFRIDS